VKTIKLGLVQMLCEKGAIDENLASTYTYLEAGMRQGVDIMCFPEMSITGYINPFRSPEAVLHLDGPEVARFVNLTNDIHAPGLYGSQATRNWLSGYQWWQNNCLQKLGRYALENSISIAVATQAGRTIDEDFPGGGYVFGPDGACLASTSDWSEGILYVELPLD